MKMNKEQVGSFIRQHAPSPEEILKEPSLVRRIRTLPNNEARLAFINKLQPPPSKGKVEEEAPPKAHISKKTLSVEMTRKTARKRTKKTLDNNS
tara:strand:- start:1267 stop:1548 length:282 start_codon:yes stop_codon:yes gene_type:complete